MPSGYPKKGKNKGWFKKGIVPKTCFKKGEHLGAETNNWKGDNASYRSLHNRVEVRRGKPRFCEVCKSTTKIGLKAYHWCNLTGDYANEKDYRRMCVSCHSKYDRCRVRFW